MVNQMKVPSAVSTSLRSHDNTICSVWVHDMCMHCATIQPHQHICSHMVPFTVNTSDSHLNHYAIRSPRNIWISPLFLTCCSISVGPRCSFLLFHPSLCHTVKHKHGYGKVCCDVWVFRSLRLFENAWKWGRDSRACYFSSIIQPKWLFLTAYSVRPGGEFRLVLSR